MSNIYLDNNATTFLDKNVFDTMYEDGLAPSNPSSIHTFGQRAKMRLQSSRLTIADYIKKPVKEILFFSSATETLNTLIRSMDGHIISSNITHPAIYDTLKALNCNCTFLESNRHGSISIEQIQSALQPDTKWLLFLASNHETGIKNPIEDIAQFAKDNGLNLVLDYSAWCGREPILLFDGIKAICFSAHKFHGPKGVACCWADSSIDIAKQQFGGNQEFTKRAGTENIAAICGMAKAIDLLEGILPQASHKMKFLRDHFEGTLKKKLDIEINGDGERVCNVSNIYFPGVDGNSLLINLDLQGVLASQGSACSAGLSDPSRILKNMGYTTDRCNSSLRFSLSRNTTLEEIERASLTIINCVNTLRQKLVLPNQIKDKR